MCHAWFYSIEGPIMATWELRMSDKLAVRELQIAL